ncbi:MAG: VanW family protein, partial [Lachnospiraceae bacterium]|nr:VanW family protein [Lachnospiraceae bacterium]
MTSKNKKLTACFVAGCVCVFGIAAFVWFSSRGVTLKKTNKISEGVTIDGVDVGGLTKEKAEQKLSDYIESLLNREVTITVDGNQIKTKAKDLGFSCESGESVEEAYEIGKEGAFSYEKLSDEDIEKGKLNLSYTVNEEKVQSFVEENCTSFVVKAKNSRLKFQDGKFIATKSREGRKVKVAETVAVISHALTKEVTAEPLEVAAVVDVSKPKYTQKQVAKCQDLIGTYSTSYGTSTAARANNVKTAAMYINGTVIYPGKTFSVVKTIKDRTEENGYLPAPEYSSGNVVEGVGGGVCQVSTTLYNAVINAELEIVERSPHSMVVAYVDVSRDAAISGNYKDFKFKNNTDVPVYIAASADGATLSFRIYGEETRPENRKIVFESKVLEKLEPGEPITTVDNTKPEGYRAVTQSAHIGYRAELWKVMYVDEKETERVRLNTSSYGAEPEHITIGKSASRPSATSTPSATDTPKPTATAKVTQKPAATKAPQVTKAPKATKEPTKEPVAT